MNSSVKKFNSAVEDEELQLLQILNVGVLEMKKFTLVELLVVVAIISILLSIFLPSLNKSREIAKMAVCLSNLKTCGVGNQLYANEYDGWAVAQWQTATNYPRWSQIEPFRNYVGWNKPNVKNWHIPNESACPKGVEKKLALGTNDTSDNGNAIKAYYSYEHVAIFGSRSYRGMKLEWLNEPALLGNAADVWIATRVSKNSMDARHNGKANFLFFDGHVKAIFSNFSLVGLGRYFQWLQPLGRFK